MNSSKAFAAALIGGTFLTGSAWAGTIEVNGGSIQSAINQAKAGDTILVQPGTYAPFEINRDGITVQSAVPGGAHVVATGHRQPAVASYGQSNVGVIGFRLTSKNGDGVKIGGSASRDVQNIRFEGNTVETAALDGLKFFQINGMKLTDNTVKQAGTSRNGNGDGGIDFVGVDNSNVQNNEVVRTFGHACFMMKGGSNGNKVTGNNFMGCERDGITVGGFTDANLMDRSDKGLEAHGNTVTGNKIQAGSSKCPIYSHKAANNTVSGNQFLGGRAGCSNSGGGGTVDIADAGAEGSNGGGTDYTGGGDNSERDNIMGSAGGSLGGSCAGSGALSNATSAAGGTSSIFSGGRATAPLQVAQQIQLVAQRICQTEQLMAQLKMLTGMDLRTADDVLYVLDRLGPLLQQGNMTISGDDLLRDLGADYPTVFEGDTFGRMKEQESLWNDRTRNALDQKSQIENTVIRSQQEALKRSANIEQAGRNSGGIRGAQLATNALLTEMMGSLNNQLVAQVAHQKALSEVQYREEAKREAANTMALDFMSTLSKCDDCKPSKPLLSN